MPSLRLHFGLPRLKGRLPEYAKAFNLLEVPCEPEPPTAKHLGRLKREAPEGFEFALVAGKALADLASSSPDPALVESTRRAAEALAARFILLRTPASAGPSARTRTKLARLNELLAGAAGGIAWEPRGMWTDEEVVQVAEELGVTLVRDLAEHDPAPGPLVYTRLLALGRNARLGSGAIERVSERLAEAEAEEAYIVIEGDGAAGIAKRLRASLGEMREDDAAGLGGEGDDEDAELDDEADEDAELDDEADDDADDEDELDDA